MLERAPAPRAPAVSTGRAASGRPVQVTPTFKGSKRQAQSALAKSVSDVESGQAPLTRETTTVAELLDRYIEGHVAVLQPGTVRGYRDKARRLKASLGPVRLTNLTLQQLDRTYRSWLTEGLSPATAHHCHALLSAAVHQAVRSAIVATAVTEKSRGDRELAPGGRRCHLLPGTIFSQASLAAWKVGLLGSMPLPRRSMTCSPAGPVLGSG